MTGPRGRSGRRRERAERVVDPGGNLEVHLDGVQLHVRAQVDPEPFVGRGDRGLGCQARAARGTCGRVVRRRSSSRTRATAKSLPSTGFSVSVRPP